MIKENIKSCKDITRSIMHIFEEKKMDNAVCLFPMLRKENNKLLLGTLIETEDEELGKRNKVSRPKYWLILDMNDLSLVELNKTSEKDYMDANIIPLDKEFDDEFKLEGKNVSKFALDKEIQYKNYLMKDIKDDVINTHNKILDAVNYKLIVDNKEIDAKDYLIANVEEELEKKVKELVELVANEKYSALIYYYQTLIEEIMQEYLEKDTINNQKMLLAAKFLDAYYGDAYGVKYFFNVQNLDNRKGELNMVKLFTKEGTRKVIDEHTALEITNLENFLGGLRSLSGKIPAPSAIITIKYKLIIDNKEYIGSSRCYTYKPDSKDEMDENCPYIVGVTDWQLGKDNPNPFIEFDIRSR